MKNASHLCSLTWVAKQGSVVVMTVKSETGLSNYLCGEQKGN